MAINKSRVINTGINSIFPAIDFYDNYKSGDGVAKSAIKAGANFAFYEIMQGIIGGGPMLAIGAASMAGVGVNALISHGRQNSQTMRSKISGTGGIGSGKLLESEHTGTMRQRALEQMGGHQALTRQALGSEARKRSMMVRY